MKLRILFPLCFCLLTLTLNGQDIPVPPDSLSIDSLSTTPVISKKEKKEKKRKKGYPNPKKAMFLSLAIPGGGQIYNKKYWKAPIAVGGVGLMVYFISFNTERYRFYREQYLFRVDGDPLTVDKFEQFGWTPDDIKQRRDYFHKNLELSYIGILGVQILGAVDAFVDAHLMNFDVSDDLSMKISPKAEFGPFEGGTLGVGVSLHLKPRTVETPIDFMGR